MMNDTTVFYHNFKTCRVINVAVKIKFIFWNNLASLFNQKFKSLSTVTKTAVFFFDELTNVAASIFK